MFAHQPRKLLSTGDGTTELSTVEGLIPTLTPRRSPTASEEKDRKEVDIAKVFDAKSTQSGVCASQSYSFPLLALPSQ